MSGALSRRRLQGDWSFAARDNEPRSRAAQTAPTRRSKSIGTGTCGAYSSGSSAPIRRYATLAANTAGNVQRSGGTPGSMVCLAIVRTASAIESEPRTNAVSSR